jgi:hypothetical protein
MRHHCQGVAGRRFVVCLLGLAGAAFLTPLVRGADIQTVAPSLKLIPADAAFYSVMLRNKEQIDIIRQSRAWAKLVEMPAVQSLWKKAKEQFDEESSFLPAFIKGLFRPENRELIELFGDMVADEIFTYGGASCSDFASLLAEIYGGMQFQRLFQRFQGLPGAESFGRVILDTLAAKPERLKVPDFVVGFRLRDTNRAETQLKRLEAVLKEAVGRFPRLEGRFQRVAVGKSSFLTLTFDGKMIPWERIPIKDLEEKPRQYDDLVKRLTALKATFSLGVRDQYLLFAIGESGELVAKLDQAGAKDPLANRRELKPLARYADRRLTSISYASKDLRTKTSLNRDGVNDLLRDLKELVPLDELPEKLQARLPKDLEELAKDLKKYIPETGASLSFSFLTEQGQEGYAYDWSEIGRNDASQSLPILNHVGGNPILAMVGRSKVGLEDYDTLVKWIKVAHDYAEIWILAKLDDTQKEQYQKFSKAIQPLARRADEVTRTLLLPALADGQAGLVIDAKLTSRQWIRMLPPTGKPLPIVEPAIVIGVSDAGKLQKAFAEYRSIANEVLRNVRDLAGERAPDLEIPEPETRAAKVGNLYYFPLPPQVPLDERLMPTLGLADKVATLTISQEHAERLLASTPLKSPAGPLANPGRPLAMATCFDWAGLIDALSPWVELGIQTAGPFLLGEVDDETLNQVRVGLSILKVVRSYTSATYREDGALVTHSLTALKDL